MPKKLLIDILIPRCHQEGLTKKDIEKTWQFKIYVLSCGLFTIAGIHKLKQGEKLFGIFLIMQSVISYISDVHTMGIYSRWHAFDRYFAFLMSIYMEIRLFYKIKESHEIFINIILALLGFKYLKNSQRLYDLNDINFLIEHSKWHCIAPLITIIN
jgi:hypothetical protein